MKASSTVVFGGESLVVDAGDGNGGSFRFPNSSVVVVFESVTKALDGIPSILVFVFIISSVLRWSPNRICLFGVLRH